MPIERVIQVMHFLLFDLARYMPEKWLKKYGSESSEFMVAYDQVLSLLEHERLIRNNARKEENHD